jgi:hypothetical protein
MVEDMKSFPHGMADTFTSLHPVLIGRSPDEAFSTVPFEKGY